MNEWCEGMCLLVHWMPCVCRKGVRIVQYNEEEVYCFFICFFIESLQKTLLLSLLLSQNILFY